MSDYTDYMEEQFFASVASARWDLFDTERWKKDYESKRDFYPPWIDINGKEYKFKDISDDYLENIIKFVKRKDPEDKTKWNKLLQCEKRYRNIDKKIAQLRAEVKINNEIIDMCF